MAGTAELRAVLALQKKQLEQLAEQQQLFEALLASQTTGTETPPTTTAPRTSAVNEAAPPEDKFVRVTFKVSRVTDIDDKSSTFTAAIKYTATWEPDHDDVQALRRHFAQVEHPSEPGVPTWNDWLNDERKADQSASGQMPNKWNFNLNPGGEKLPAGVWEPRLWIRNEYDRHANYDTLTLTLTLTLIPTLTLTLTLILTLTLTLILTRHANYEEEWFAVLPTHEKDGGALLSYTRETQSTFYESFELRSFPFDNQQLHSMVKTAVWAVPQLGSCASPGRAPGGSGRLGTPRERPALWPSVLPGGEAGPLGAQPPPRVLELAASEAADSAALDHSGCSLSW